MRVLVLLLLLSCGSGQPADVAAFVRSGAYRSWHAEPAPHATRGPHGTRVRTFINDALFDSLAAKASSHPPGASAVKELFSGDSVTGWAVDTKASDGVWEYFEGFEPTLDQYRFRGPGNLCANCHASGVDSVLTPLSAFQ